MLVWKGWGILAILIPMVLVLLINEVLEYFYGLGAYKESDWGLPVVLFISSLFIYPIGLKLNSKPGRILIDPENNEAIELKTIHSMFWIPLQYWSFILIALGIWKYVDQTGLI